MTTDRRWVTGSNIPGYLPDTDVPLLPVTWADGIRDLQADLMHEATLVDEMEGPAEDSIHLREQADALDHLRPGTPIDVSANDATGQVRVFFLQLAE